MMLFKYTLIFCVISLCKYVQCTCDQNQFSCTTRDGKYGTCVNGSCTVIHAEERSNLRFTVVVKYPESNLQAHNGLDLYMRGNSLGFSWGRGIRLNKTAGDTWRAEVLYRSSSDGFRCQHCNDNSSFNGAYFEYRILIGDKINMIGGNFQLKLPVSRSSSYFSDAPVYYAYPWFFSKKGSISVVPIHASEIGKTRDIVIYKPPSFHENTYKTYPTILVFDLHEDVYNASAKLIDAPVVERGTVGEFMIVGFGDYKPEDERMELLTQVNGAGFLYLCINGSLSDGCGHCMPDNVHNFTDYIWYMYHKCGRHEEVVGKGNDTVLPKTKKLTGMRMRTDQPNLGVMGYSLGGLMACHAAWTRPNIFGFAACQSPSFWWPATKNFTDAAFFFNKISLKDPKLRTNRPFQRIYLDAGGTEIIQPFTLTQSMVAAAEDMRSTGYFEWDKNLWANVFPGDPHSSAIWISRLWVPLRIFFPTNPGPSMSDAGVSLCPSKIPPSIIG